MYLGENGLSGLSTLPSEQLLVRRRGYKLFEMRIKRFTSQFKNVSDTETWRPTRCVVFGACGYLYCRPTQIMSTILRTRVALVFRLLFIRRVETMLLFIECYFNFGLFDDF
jgi:hypothetical protein